MPFDRDAVARRYAVVPRDALDEFYDGDIPKAIKNDLEETGDDPP